MDKKMLGTGTVPLSDTVHRLPAAANGERKPKTPHTLQESVVLNALTMFGDSKRQDQSDGRRRRGRRASEIAGGDGDVIFPFGLGTALASAFSTIPFCPHLFLQWSFTRRASCCTRTRCFHTSVRPVYFVRIITTGAWRVLVSIYLCIHQASGEFWPCSCTIQATNEPRGDGSDMYLTCINKTIIMSYPPPSYPPHTSIIYAPVRIR